MATSSISRSLLTSVLSVYFILTFIVTCVQVVGEYFDTKRVLVEELQNQQLTFNGSLTRSLWEFNTGQIEAIAEGLIGIPAISGVVIRSDAGEVLIQLGEGADLSMIPNEASEGTVLPEKMASSVTFPH